MPFLVIIVNAFSTASGSSFFSCSFKSPKHFSQTPNKSADLTVSGETWILVSKLLCQPPVLSFRLMLLIFVATSAVIALKSMLSIRSMSSRPRIGPY